MDPREFSFTLSSSRGPVIQRQGRGDRCPPGEGPRVGESCTGRGTQGILYLSAGGGRRRGTRRIIHRRIDSPQRSSHSELSPRQSPRHSQRSLTAAVAAKLTCSINQPVYYTLNLSR